MPALSAPADEAFAPSGIETSSASVSGIAPVDTKKQEKETEEVNKAVASTHPNLDELEELKKRQEGILRNLERYDGPLSQQQLKEISDNYGKKPTRTAIIVTTEEMKKFEGGRPGPRGAGYLDEIKGEKSVEWHEKVIKDHFGDKDDAQVKSFRTVEKGTGREMLAILGIDVKTINGLIEMEYQKEKAAEREKQLDEKINAERKHGHGQAATIKMEDGTTVNAADLTDTVKKMMGGRADTLEQSVVADSQVIADRVNGMDRASAAAHPEARAAAQADRDARISPDVGTGRAKPIDPSLPTPARH